MGMISNAILSLKNKVQTMMQRTVVTRSNPVVPGEYPTYQVRGLGNRISDVENVTPYGLASTLPAEVKDATTGAVISQGALGVKFNVQGDGGNQVGFSYDPTTLPSLLPDGEVAVGNFQIGTFLKFTNLGTIEVFQNGILVITDLAKHIHSGVTTGPGVSGPPVL